MTLFDGSADEAGNADTVATHFKRLRLAVFVKERRVHRFGILRAEVEDVSDFDTALQLQFPLAAGACVPFDDVAEVFDEGFGEVAPEVDARVVEAGNVGAAAEVGHIGDGAVGIDDDVGGADRAEAPRGRARKVFGDFGFGRHAEAFLQFRELPGLDFV